MTDTKVVGFLAYINKETPLCSGDACVISSSEEEMYQYALGVNAEQIDLIKIRKVRFGDIFNGLQRGGAYAFNKESYERFFPLAKQKGLPVKEIDYKDAESKGKNLFIIRIT